MKSWLRELLTDSIISQREKFNLDANWGHALRLENNTKKFPVPELMSNRELGASFRSRCFQAREIDGLFRATYT